MGQDHGISIEDARCLLDRAIPAVVTGDLTAIELFTEDVTGDAEHLSIGCRTELEHQMVDRAGVLSRVAFRIDRLEEVADTVLAIWQLSGDHTAEVLVDEDELIEPSGRRVELAATTSVTFRERRICSFRIAYIGPSLVAQIRAPAPPRRP